MRSMLIPKRQTMFVLANCFRDDLMKEAKDNKEEIKPIRL